MEAYPSEGPSDLEHRHSWSSSRSRRFICMIDMRILLISFEVLKHIVFSGQGSKGRDLVSCTRPPGLHAPNRRQGNDIEVQGRAQGAHLECPWLISRRQCVVDCKSSMDCFAWSARSKLKPLQLLTCRAAELSNHFPGAASFLQSFYLSSMRCMRLSNQHMARAVVGDLGAGSRRGC